MTCVRLLLVSVRQESVRNVMIQWYMTVGERRCGRCPFDICFVYGVGQNDCVTVLLTQPIFYTYLSNSTTATDGNPSNVGAKRSLVKLLKDSQKAATGAMRSTKGIRCSETTRLPFRALYQASMTEII